MLKNKMIRFTLVAVLGATLLFAALSFLLPVHAIAVASGTTLPLVDDFETGKLPTGKDANNLAIGYVTWSDGSPIALTVTTVAAGSPLAMPNQTGNNTILKMDSNINSWGGFTHAFENETVNTWTPQDWRSYSGIGFWLYGTGKGTGLFFELKENRNPGSTKDDAETWTHPFTDSVAGWRYVEIPFNAFTSKNIGNGAPNDGFTGEQIHGWAFGSLTSGGAQSHYLDNIMLIVRKTVIDDFETGKLPTGKDANNLSIGYVTWSDGSPIALTTTTVAANSPLALPNQTGANIVLKINSNINQWGGFTHAFENEAVNTWTPQDWSSYEGVSFWLYGTGKGTGLFFELKENRNPGSTTDDAETWTHPFTDSVAGWRYIEVPFTTFTSKNIGNGAPNDGFTGEQIHGWAFGSLTSGGAQTHYLDNIAIYGRKTTTEQKVKVAFNTNRYTAREGTTATITVTLNATSTTPITVSYATRESGAIDGRDYEAISGTLVFPPNSLTQTFSVKLWSDKQDERKDELIVLLLSQPEGAALGYPFRTILVIQDDNAPNVMGLDDFNEGFYGYQTTGNVTLTTDEVMTGTAMAVPGQAKSEGILKVAHTNGGKFNRTFTSPQNWSNYGGLRFWYHGKKSGQSITMTIQDNLTQTTANVTPDKWVLRWSEEFSETAGTPPNPNIWTPEIGDGALVDNVGWGNSELQYYTDSKDNAATDGNGNMVITVLKNDNPDYMCAYIPPENGTGNGTCGYTSARLMTYDKVEFLYGRIEARAKVPAGVGLWPAFWALGNDIFDQNPWPISGEIDVMEFVGKSPHDVLGTIHGPGYSGGAGVGGKYVFTNPVADDYHTFSVDWTPTEIKWYVDNINYFTASTKTIPTGTRWVYDHPFFLILNVAVGGNLGGNVNSTFPQKLEVDYIRVYQAPDSSQQFTASFSDNFNGWQEVTVPFSRFKAATQQPLKASSDNLTLTNVSGYGFTVNGAGSFSLDNVHLVDKAAITADSTYLPLINK